MLPWRFAAVSTLLGTALCAAPAPADYTAEVKPILKQHCYRCHGGSQQKGGLRADTVAFLREGGDIGPAFKAGHSAESLMVQAILGTHDDIAQMPYKKPPLAEAEIARIRAWIDAGAPAPENEEPEKDLHWAFVPPKRAELPSVSRPEWARNPIDRFILARLEKEKIAPAPDADRVTLLRRVSLDPPACHPRRPKSRHSRPTSHRMHIRSRRASAGVAPLR
jgi:mono/diheme cytochrome c family protein